MVDQAKVDALIEAQAVERAAGTQQAKPLVKKAWLFAAACWAVTLLLPWPVGAMIGAILGLVALFFVVRLYTSYLRGGSFRGVLHLIGIMGIGFIVFMAKMLMHVAV